MGDGIWPKFRGLIDHYTLSSNSGSSPCMFIEQLYGLCVYIYIWFILIYIYIYIYIYPVVYSWLITYTYTCICIFNAYIYMYICIMHILQQLYISALAQTQWSSNEHRQLGMLHVFCVLRWRDFCSENVRQIIWAMSRKSALGWIPQARDSGTVTYYHIGTKKRQQT